MVNGQGQQTSRTETQRPFTTMGTSVLDLSSTQSIHQTPLDLRRYQSPHHPSHLFASSTLIKSSLPRMKSQDENHFYTMEKIAEQCFHAIQNRYKTWQFVPGRDERLSNEMERPSRRLDVLDLTTCFETAMSYIDKKTTKQNKQHIALMDREWRSIQTRVLERYGEMEETKQTEMIHLVFQQKWSDLVLGEVEAMLLTSFLEQGVLLKQVRIHYAQAFRSFENMYMDQLKVWKQLQMEMETIREQQMERNRQNQQERIEMETKYQKQIDQLHHEYRTKETQMEMKMNEYKEQMMKMSDTMKTLNTLFRQMREDSEKVKAIEIRDHAIKVEQYCQELEEEKERLKPFEIRTNELEQSNEKMQSEMEMLRQQIVRMENEIAAKDQVIVELMEQQSQEMGRQEWKREQEIEHKNRPSISVCLRCKQRDTESTTDSSLPVQKKRIMCEYYRSLLPNLYGRRPMREMMWTMSCMRSILFAKQIQDTLHQRHQTLRLRMPEFVYSWFSSSTDMDEYRWCFYYGIKALAQEGLLEAKIFLSLLDERYGEDEQVFVFYCYRILDILSQGQLEWGSLRTCMNYQTFQQAYEQGGIHLPKTIWISPYHASLATSIVLYKASEQDRNIVENQLNEFIITNLPQEEQPKVYLTPSKVRSKKNEQPVIDAHLWIELMMIEYKEEQAHRRAAIRLMFQTVTSETSTMNMEQFHLMIQTLNDSMSLDSIASLYRATYVRGNGLITFEAFMEAADTAQFFSSCMRLQNPTQCMVSRSLVSPNTRATTIVDRLYTLIQPELSSLHLPVSTQQLIQASLDELSNRSHENGVDSIASLYRILDTIWITKWIQHQVTGKSVSSLMMNRIEKALYTLFYSIQANDQTTMKWLIHTVHQEQCVRRVQKVFRKHLAQDEGVPLSMRTLFHSSYSQQHRINQSRRGAIRSMTWLRTVIGDIFRLLLQSDRIDRLLSELSSVNSTLSPAQWSVNGGIGPAPRPLILQVVYDYFIEIYGVRIEAEKVMNDLFIQSRTLVSIHPIVHVFTYLTSTHIEDRLMGQNEAVAFILTVFRCGLHPFRVLQCSSEQPQLIDVSIAKMILDTAFVKLGRDQMEQVYQRFEQERNGLNGIEEEWFLLFVLYEWKRYVSDRMKEIRLICIAMENETKWLEIDAIAIVLQKSNVLFSKEDLWSVFRRFCTTGKSILSDENQVGDRLAAACFPLVARETMVEMQRRENMENQSFQTSVHDKVAFLNETWADYAPPCAILLEQLRRIVKNNNFQSRTPQDANNISSQDVVQLEALFHVFLERLDRIKALRHTNEDHISIHETWKMFRQLIVSFSRLRLIGQVGDGPLPDIHDKPRT